MTPLTDLYNSFFNSKDGFSARKLTAFTLIACTVYLHWKYCDVSNAVEFLWADLVFACLFLGIVTAQNIIDIKHGKRD